MHVKEVKMNYKKIYTILKEEETKEKSKVMFEKYSSSLDYAYSLKYYVETYSKVLNCKDELIEITKELFQLLEDKSKESIENVKEKSVMKYYSRECNILYSRYQKSCIEELEDKSDKPQIKNKINKCILELKRMCCSNECLLKYNEFDLQEEILDKIYEVCNSGRKLLSFFNTYSYYMGDKTKSIEENLFEQLPYINVILKRFYEVASKRKSKYKINKSKFLLAISDINRLLNSKRTGTTGFGINKSVEKLELNRFIKYIDIER